MAHTQLTSLQITWHNCLQNCCYQGSTFHRMGEEISRSQARNCGTSWHVILAKVHWTYEKYIQLCNYHHNKDRKQFHYPKISWNPLCSRTSLGATFYLLLLFCFYSLALQECHVNGIHVIVCSFFEISIICNKLKKTSSINILVDILE